MPHGRLRFAWIPPHAALLPRRDVRQGTTANEKGVGTQASPRVILSDIWRIVTVSAGAADPLRRNDLVAEHSEVLSR